MSRRRMSSVSVDPSIAWWSSMISVSPSGSRLANSRYSRTIDVITSACEGPPAPRPRIRSSVSVPKSGSTSRPAATRWRRKTSQSRSSGSRRYQAVRRGDRDAQSARSVVLPKPASAMTRTTRPVAARSSQSLSRGRDRISARRSGGCTFAPVIGKGYDDISPAPRLALDQGASDPVEPGSPADARCAARADPGSATGGGGGSRGTDGSTAETVRPSGRGRARLGMRRRMPRPAHRALICSSTDTGPRQPSYSNPILSSTWYSTISPSSIFAVDFTTSIVRMLRTVFEAVATAWRAASDHDRGLDPTISRMMITPTHVLLWLRRGQHRQPNRNAPPVAPTARYGCLTLGGDGGVGLHLVEAGAAVDGAVVARLERDHRLAPTAVADGGVVLTRSAGAPCPRVLRRRPAARTSLRVVGQALACKKRLFAGREDERLAAIAAGQRTILEHPSFLRA